MPSRGAMIAPILIRTGITIRKGCDPIHEIFHFMKFSQKFLLFLILFLYQIVGLPIQKQNDLKQCLDTDPMTIPFPGFQDFTMKPFSRHPAYFL
jgi:hypothetical protein